MKNNVMKVSSEIARKNVTALMANVAQKRANASAQWDGKVCANPIDFMIYQQKKSTCF